MSLPLNILWFFLGGFVVFFAYLIGGIILCITIIGIPFGIQCFKLSILGLAPFGRGNPEPVVAIRGCRILTGPTRIGKTGKTITMTVSGPE